MKTSATWGRHYDPRNWEALSEMEGTCATDAGGTFHPEQQAGISNAMDYSLVDQWAWNDLGKDERTNSVLWFGTGEYSI